LFVSLSLNRYSDAFRRRLHLLEAEGVDAVVLHPRFFEEKFKRRARLELLPWVASLTSLPLIANGDITGPDFVRAHAPHLQAAAGIMLGRTAVVQPWIFATWDAPVEVDLAAV
jgi:tRNA-dihydrouridine synthase